VTTLQTTALLDEHRRDAGLVRAVGVLALSASIFNGVVGAGIFTVPGALAAAIGPYAPFAFLVCAFGIAAIAICFAEGGSRVATSGGAYGYVEVAFGPLAGFIAALLLLLSDVLACGGIAAALADAVASVAPARAAAAARLAVIAGVIGGISMINVRGVTQGARLINLATLLKLVPLLVFVAVGASCIHGANFALQGAPNPSGVGRALILAFFAFTGMESSVCASGEVAHPARTIPRALAFAMLTVTGLYVAIQGVTQGILGSALATSTVPLADAMATISQPLRVLMLVGAAVSMFGWLCNDLLCSPRLLFALARDGLLPRQLGRVHARHNTPYVSILLYGTVAFGLAVTGTFAELAVLSTLMGAALYIGACLASWRLARRGLAVSGRPLGFRWLGAAAAIGVAAMLVLIALATRTEILGLVGVVAAGALLYALRVRIGARPAVLEHE
jgi:amino acid transporter